jgi:hypothetical protein
MTDRSHHKPPNPTAQPGEKYPRYLHPTAAGDSPNNSTAFPYTIPGVTPVMHR